LLEQKSEFEQSLTFLDGIANRKILLFPLKRLLQSFWIIWWRGSCIAALDVPFSDAHPYQWHDDD
jgi:hypothetical protein